MPLVRRWTLMLAMAWCGVVGGGGLEAAEEENAPAEVGTITNPDVIWDMSLAERERVYPIRIEGRVNYYDPGWGNLWFEQQGRGRYIRISRNPPVMRNGQRVRIEGTYIPEQGLNADRIRVTVLDENVPGEVVETRGRIAEVAAFDRKIVLTEGYVDDQQLIDSQHLRLTMIVDNRRLICWVPPDPDSALPDWQGCFLRLQGVYSGRLDPTGTDATVELWVARPSEVKVLRAVTEDPRFAGLYMGAGRVSALPLGSTVRVRGFIHSREIGVSFVLRDQTGEVLVRSLQNERVPRGTAVEVVGRVAVEGSRWVLESALFRRSSVYVPGETGPLGPTLDRVERIRQLSPAEAAEGKPVEITGVVTWSLPEADFFFLQDLSGGVRVRLPAGMAAPPLQKSGRVVGVTCRGAFGPAVELHEFHDTGSMANPLPKRITYQQAITGGEDGQWVEMRGFIRRTASEGDWRWIYVTTPEGEFVGHLQSAVNFVATPGSLIRVRGVCELTADARNRISGVRLRVPYLHDILIEEDAPADVYDLPLRRVADLSRLFEMENLVRARVSVQVVHHVPGQSIVVQDGTGGLTIFSREPGQLAPGDTIDAVGIVGRDGARMVLREAAFRRTKVATAPAPVVLPDVSVQDFANDLRLVQVQARLLDSSRHTDRLHLLMQAENTIFDATLDYAVGAEPERTFRPGMLLSLTGIYRIVFDDFDRPRGFQVQLRTPADVVLIEQAHFWTVGRALAMAGGLCGFLLVGFVWLVALRHRVRVQTGQIREQLEKQSNLEGELERAQRFRSLGLLAGGLAHDFNNLLTGILGNVTLAMLDDRAMPLVGDSLRDIEASAKRARDLTQQLVTFAKGGDPMREVVPLPELVHNAAGFALSGARARAEFRFAEGLWAVHADRNQLGRALQNLIVHARGAMPEGGIITVAAENETVATLDGSLPLGRYVRLTIVDRGAGVPADRLPGFFDPYASSKFGDDRFALAIAYSIVIRHGGNLEVESVAEVGTTFRLWIPAADEPVAAAPVVVETAAPVDITGTRVLLMDDEQTIRRLAERLFKRLRCEICTVADGAACVQAYREALADGRGYQIVILDLTVPGGMGGRECMEALRALDPQVRAIVSSGYSNDPVMANYRRHGFLAVVQKPYAVEVLEAAIIRVLGAPRA